MKKTLYDILGVPPDASAEQIAQAYHALMETAASDPDLNQRVLVHEAHSILSDVQQRAAYDASLVQPSSVPATPEPDDDGDSGNPSRTWAIRLLVGLCLATGLYWWQGTTKPRMAPTMPSQNSIAESTASSSAPAEALAATPPGKSLEELYSSLSGRVALIVVADDKGNPIRSGSGVVVDAGAVITGCHVTKGSAQIRVKVAGRLHNALPQITDGVFDLCRLDVTGLAATPIKIIGVSALRPGQKVYAIGASRGPERNIGAGTILSLRETPSGPYIQITVPISPSSSGGGLFDADGQLLGIVTAQHRFGADLNVALPADRIGAMRERDASTGTENADSGDTKKAPTASDVKAPSDSS